MRFKVQFIAVLQVAEIKGARGRQLWRNLLEAGSSRR